MSGASHEQSCGVQQVTTALSQMERVTQCCAATAEENAAAGQKLNTQSAELKMVVEQLRVMVDG